jgi:hypothetical protein
MSAGGHRHLEQVIGQPVLERRHASELESSCRARTDIDNLSEACTAGAPSPPAYTGKFAAAEQQVRPSRVRMRQAGTGQHGSPRNMRPAPELEALSDPGARPAGISFHRLIGQTRLVIANIVKI